MQNQCDQDETGNIASGISDDRGCQPAKKPVKSGSIGFSGTLVFFPLLVYRSEQDHRQTHYQCHCYSCSCKHTNLPGWIMECERSPSIPAMVVSPLNSMGILASSSTL